MELRQMEYVVAVAEEGHFTRAAALCGVSQSGLSAAIRSLEKELGAPLFQRTTRQVSTTAAGRALLPFARRMLAQAAGGRDAVVRASRQLSGHLRVGSEQCLGVVDVGSLLERFRLRHPLVEIQFVQAGSHELAAQLRAGDLDVGFLAATEHLGGLRRLELGRRDVVVLTHPSDPLAGSAGITWEDLAERDFVDFRETWSVRRLVDEAFAARHLDRRVRMSVDDVHTLLDFVQRGLGIAIVPQHVAAKPQAAGLTASALPEQGRPQWVVSAVSSPVAAPTASRLLELLVEANLEVAPAA
ncbi:DNA-binding transcriptional LysR family regulator [Isoptericola jiangsuensis]|uniref:DNA-binding transcriptional LysR family regulator n=1 Tax=Isoptericola jiangsuensis TaxID=548579 RepID=A0A2A9F122_9MICO|nr:LysR substrate-binding domain-containing protein [Isoptericola jiangsuensis]PFG44242.1 DNA-binding transcriptional LysR family regulator [Isoptericola jiangsuensis]